MSDDWKASVARRPLLAALGALVGVGAIGGVIYEAPNLLSARIRKGSYEDLVSLLPDREDAAQVGRSVLAADKAFKARQTAHDLRQRIGTGPLSSVLSEDAVRGRLVETEGWVLPETLVGLCALAAKAA